MSLLIGFSAYFLDDSQIVPAGIYGKSFLVQDETLVIVDKLLRHLTESNIFGAKLLFDELCQGSPGIDIGRISSLCTVYPDALPQILADNVRHLQQGHLCSETSLKQILDAFCIKIDLTFHQGIECRMDGEHQLVQLRIGLHGFMALTFQTAFTRIPQVGCAGDFATELHHRTIDGDTSHNGRFARLVQPALFEVEQHLEFFYFHTL